MLVYVLQHNERFLIDRSDPFWEHIASFKWWLLPHGIAGACALLLGPMQFSDRLRSRYAKLHRIVGRIYVGGVFIVSPLGAYIQYYEERLGVPRSFTFAALTFAVLWFGTTAIAFVLILQGKVEPHRRWMTRSFAFALVFLEVRVISGLLGYDADIRMSEVLVWMCTAFASLLADVTLQIQETLRGRRRTTRAVA
jgi:uncharacterized membrane protein